MNRAVELKDGVLSVTTRDQGSVSYDLRDVTSIHYIPPGGMLEATCRVTIGSTQLKLGTEHFGGEDPFVDFVTELHRALEAKALSPSLTTGFAGATALGAVFVIIGLGLLGWVVFESGVRGKPLPVGPALGLAFVLISGLRIFSWKPKSYELSGLPRARS